MTENATKTDGETATAREKAIHQTRIHIHAVQSYLLTFCSRLMARGINHDTSKYSDAELGPLTVMMEVIEREGPAPFGSAEYKRRTDMLGPMTAHHYRLNPHHPEHYSDGIAGMDLLDLCEMFCDWRAAADRGGDADMNISHCVERFKIEPQLASILRNTADRMGFKHK